MPSLTRTTKIELSSYGNDKANLHCPRCGGNNLHQLEVTVFHREEDAESIVRIKVKGASTSTEVVPDSGSGNPSSRRDGLAIEFSCEHCSEDDPSDIIELTVAQHKGSTELGWRFTPLRKQL
jgi:hypothetical protein